MKHKKFTGEAAGGGSVGSWCREELLTYLNITVLSHFNFYLLISSLKFAHPSIKKKKKKRKNQMMCEEIF